MEEDKNIIKKVEMYLKEDLNTPFTFYIDLETLSEIENGTFKRPYMKFTDFKRECYIKVSEISFLYVYDENELLRHELEEEMSTCLRNGDELPYFIYCYRK